ncbi:hypothetical protein GSI_09066 [Ganoderma sinense ZZ0214-1]|uniref:Uncharacterized protein n=1 Tax=Ganoderma sinense ZZ0214-1 TaxID=1077348 RepID=A0A2G8S653_9APHY|nr:hypothetical protein GSI_09066 [Ganoderma sinense ZZ0214-1]
MSAGPSRSRARVTRVELTADQLLGADLTPARPHKASKHAPKVITVEQLLGSSLTITPAARGGSGSSSATSPSSSRSASRTAARPNSVRSAAARSPSPPRVPVVVPHRERVTADEVLRTGVPLRTLQAAKQRARSGQALVLTAEQLLGSSAGSSRSHASSSSTRGLAAESSRRPNTAGEPTSAATPSTGSRSSRIVRPSTAGATTGGDGSASAARGRENRPRQARRSSSLGSTHTLPIYTKEPGESEVVIDRGTEDLEDEVPITVMTPVEEDGPNLANGLPNQIPSPPASPDITQSLSPAASPTASSLAPNSTQSRVINPIHVSPSAPISIPAAIGRTPRYPGVRLAPFPDEIPSYEAVMSMSTPDLHGFPANIPLPSSPPLSAIGSPRALSPSTGSPSTPASPISRPDSSSPSSPDGAESPRRRFGFMSLFHSHSHHSHSHGSGTRNRGRSVSGLPSQTPEGAAAEQLSASPPVECPRPRLRSSRSVLDMLSRSWSDNHMARSRSDRGLGGA